MSCFRRLRFKERKNIPPTYMATAVCQLGGVRCCALVWLYCLLTCSLPWHRATERRFCQACKDRQETGKSIPHLNSSTFLTLHPSFLFSLLLSVASFVIAKIAGCTHIIDINGGGVFVTEAVFLFFLSLLVMMGSGIDKNRSKRKELLQFNEYFCIYRNPYGF